MSVVSVGLSLERMLGDEEATSRQAESEELLEKHKHTLQVSVLISACYGTNQSSFYDP